MPALAGRQDRLRLEGLGGGGRGEAERSECDRAGCSRNGGRTSRERNFDSSRRAPIERRTWVGWIGAARREEGAADRSYWRAGPRDRAGACRAWGDASSLSSRKPEQLAELVESLPGEGHRTIVSDLAEEGAALKLLADAGEVDVLVANAGLPGTGQLEDFTQEEIGRALRVNLESPVRLAREVLPAMRERDEGHLVFVSSISGQAATAWASMYCATKFGLRGFALALREDLRGTGVGASVISPGAVRDAGMFADSGSAPPPGLGTATPEQVSSAVISAIERNRGEVTVAPLRQRALGKIGMIAPELSGRVAGRKAAEVAERRSQGGRRTSGSGRGTPAGEIRVRDQPTDALKRGS